MIGMEEFKEQTALSTQAQAFLTEKLLKGEALDIEKPFSRRVFLLHTFVAGSNHVTGIRRLAKGLREHDGVLLIREPKNEHDDLAILVKNKAGKKLGYIPRMKNEVLARLMDAGKTFEAEVAKVQDNTKEGRDVYYPLDIWINVYMVD